MSANGDIVVGEMRLRALMAAGADVLAAELDTVLGTAWDEALEPYRHDGLTCRFISNIDPTDAGQKLKGLDPETTLFIVSSKTFGTLETLTNARLARAFSLVLVIVLISAKFSWRVRQTPARRLLQPLVDAPVLQERRREALVVEIAGLGLTAAAGETACPVTRLDQAQPGDILSWWTVGSDSNDHSMLIVAVDWQSAKAYPADHALSDPALAGTTYYEVEVVDSSSGTHTNDSRVVSVNGVDTQIAGIGTGTIGLLVNASFEIVGYTWSLPTSNYDTQRTGYLWIEFERAGEYRTVGCGIRANRSTDSCSLPASVTSTSGWLISIKVPTQTANCPFNPILMEPGIKPFSKSVWITLAACGAFHPW